MPAAWPPTETVVRRGPALLEWAEANGARVDEILHGAGALLIRGLKINQSSQFEAFLETLFQAPLLNYENRSTPRSRVGGNVFTSTEYPPDEMIPLHNENSYTTAWAMRIAFLSVVTAESGGATPIADSREVYRRIPARVRDAFESRRLLYVRNFGSLDLPWQEVFGTDDPEQVGVYCRANGIDHEWRSDGTLVTRQLCQVTATHPTTGDVVWFNQAHLFHVSSLRPEVREAMLSTFGEDRLPRNVYFGDGGAIPTDMLAEIRAAYDACMVAFPWQPGDLLLLDNMLSAHGRQPYSGPRKVLVGMSRPFSGKQNS